MRSDQVKTPLSVEEVIQAHTDSGYFFSVDGVQSFCLDAGKGEAVLCLHGVPTSSFIYRKMIKRLAQIGLRGLAIDFPGLGLADRPEDFDYTFPGFASFLAKALDVLQLQRFHLVVHDIGGPIGFALAATQPGRILSLTILNSFLDVRHYRKPLPMRLFEAPLVGEAELSLLNRVSWHTAFSNLGVKHPERIPTEESYAYLDLLKRGDRGRAFLKIMRSFDKTVEFTNTCMGAVRNVPYPLKLIWGIEDTALRFEVHGKQFLDLADLREVHQLPVKHMLQEELPNEVADLIAGQARNIGGGGS